MIFGRGWHAAYGKCAMCIKDIVKFRIMLSVTEGIVHGKIFGEMSMDRKFRPVADIDGTFVDEILRFRATYRTLHPHPYMFYQLFTTTQHKNFFGTFMETSDIRCRYSHLYLHPTGLTEITFSNPL